MTILNLILAITSFSRLFFGAENSARELDFLVAVWLICHTQKCRANDHNHYIMIGHNCLAETSGFEDTL